MKIGASESGGIFVAKNIQSEFHSHHLVALVLSLGRPFRVFHNKTQSEEALVALIPKDTKYKLSTTDETVFAHYDPYSQLGLQLTPNENAIKILNHENFTSVFEQIDTWVASDSISSKETESLLIQIAKLMTSTEFCPRQMDERILQVIHFAADADLDTVNVAEASKSIFLSQSRFSHLFKQETGLTFRKFLQHRKLVRSLQTMHVENKFSEIAMNGGFTDQPHFIKTFKKSFGIKPSSSKE